MNKGKRNTFLAIGFYLAVLGLAWTWFHPYFVGERIRENISVGASIPEVEKTFLVKAYHFPGAAYCGKNGPPNIKKIAVDEVGRVPLFPLPRVAITTTTFCFDKNDKLVATKTERWFDELYKHHE